MKRKRDRDISAFSLSFLDIISCGFGAVILLFVISLGSERVELIQILESLQKLFQQRLVVLTEIQANKDKIKQQLSVQQRLIIEEQEALVFMETELDELDNQINEADFGKDALVVEIEETQEEIDARQKELDIPQYVENPLPVGVPVESNHLIFILDTSGSMRNPSTALIWPIVIRKIRETLDSYPIVEGIQFMDADGNYLISSSRGQWLPDSPETRRSLVRIISSYHHHSESNPVPGIYRAIRTYSDPGNKDKKIGIYVIGDEFIETAEKALIRMDKINPLDEDGNRPITINAIGFPHVVKYERHFTQTGLKFANLMREMTYQHGGAFIGIEN